MAEPGDDGAAMDPERTRAEALGTLDEDDPLNPAAWYGEPDVCGSCIAWRPEDPRPGEEVAAGACKLRAELGRVPASLKKCSIYKPRGQFRYEPARGSPTRRRKTAAARVMLRSAEGALVPVKAPPRRDVPAYRAGPEPDVEVVVERVGPRGELFPEEDWGTEEPRPPRPVRVAPATVELGGEESGSAVRQAIVDLLRKEHGRSPREIHSKYRTGGHAVARATDGAEVQIPAERFFSLLDRLRSSLDALEAELGRRSGLAEEREELVAMLRRMQGSFTTFNLIFSGKEDYFSGKE